MTATLTPPPPALPLYRSQGLRALEAAASKQPLMERAGLAAADLAASLCRPGPLLVLAGPGNNGGDAYVAARHLQARFFAVQVVAWDDGQRAPADARSARQAFLEAGGAILDAIPPAPAGAWCWTASSASACNAP